MSAPARALQEAVFSTLSGDATLAALLGGANVFDGAPRNQPAPYVHLGELTARDWSTATEAGTEINFAVVAWSRAEGRSEGLAIADRVVALLHDAGAGARWISAGEPAASLDGDGARGEAGGAADGGAVQGGGGARIAASHGRSSRRSLAEPSQGRCPRFEHRRHDGRAEGQGPASEGRLRRRRRRLRRSPACARGESRSTPRRSTSPMPTRAGRWRELLEGAGVRRPAISGSGIFKDAASDESVRSLFFDGGIRDWQVIVPDFGTISGPFQVTGLEYAGEHDGEVSYDIALESAGELRSRRRERDGSSVVMPDLIRASIPTLGFGRTEWIAGSSPAMTTVGLRMANRHRGEISASSTGASGRCA